MGRETRTSGDKRTPRVKPVQQIQLSDAHLKKRAIAAVLFLLIGAGLLVYCFMSFLSPAGGWNTVEATRTENDSSEFVLQYYFGANGANISAENKAITALYNQAAETQYRLFNDTEEFDGTVNICTVNKNPNTELTVEPLLYETFSKLKEHGSRYIYLAPIYGQYENVFYCADDVMLSDFDPVSDSGIREYYGEILKYANDPSAVSLELLGDNKVRLAVSEEYLKYAEEEGIESFISLMWLKNAFAVDYIAEEMIKGGFRIGSISSYDGFVRNFDSISGTDYSFNLFDRSESEVYQASAMQYVNEISIVFLRNYPLSSDLDRQHYYVLSNGEIRTPYLDMSEAVPKSSLDNLVSYSSGEGEKGCADILLEILPLYVADGFDENALNSLTAKGIRSVYFKDQVLCYNDESLRLAFLFDKDGVRYTSEFVGGL